MSVYILLCLQGKQENRVCSIEAMLLAKPRVVKILCSIALLKVTHRFMKAIPFSQNISTLLNAFKETYLILILIILPFWYFCFCFSLPNAIFLTFQTNGRRYIILFLDPKMSTQGVGFSLVFLWFLFSLEENF